MNLTLCLPKSIRRRPLCESTIWVVRYLLVRLALSFAALPLGSMASLAENSAPVHLEIQVYSGSLFESAPAEPRLRAEVEVGRLFFLVNDVPAGPVTGMDPKDMLVVSGIVNYIDNQMANVDWALLDLRSSLVYKMFGPSSKESIMIGTSVSTGFDGIRFTGDLLVILPATGPIDERVTAGAAGVSEFWELHKFP